MVLKTPIIETKQVKPRLGCSADFGQPLSCIAPSLWGRRTAVAAGQFWFGGLAPSGRRNRCLRYRWSINCSDRNCCYDAKVVTRSTMFSELAIQLLVKTPFKC